MAPGFPVPPNSDYKGYHAYIDECLPPESPYLYGLHPNAEIEFLTTNSDNLFRTVFEMQPRDAGAGASGGVTKDERIKVSVKKMSKECSLNDAVFSEYSSQPMMIMKRMPCICSARLENCFVGMLPIYAIIYQIRELKKVKKSVTKSLLCPHFQL